MIYQNGKLQAMTLGSTGSSSGLVSYTTEEAMIGTWIDGKPLYQMSFTGRTVGAVSSDIILANIANNSNVVDIRGYLEYSDHQVFSLQCAADAWYNVIWYRRGQIIFITSNSGFLNRPYVVTIQYTKDTDKPVTQLTATIPESLDVSSVASSAVEAEFDSFTDETKIK